MQPYSIEPYRIDLRSQLLMVWERSVLATHHFLIPGDFAGIKAIVQGIDFTAFDVYCMMDNQIVAGFIGVADAKIEMLFVDPHFFGKGIGTRLTRFAIEKLKATKVDVNEQNEKAVAFYLKEGFKILERTKKDDQGKPYPLLRMGL